MRIRMIGITVTCAVVISACGSTGGKLATELRPPNPVNLTVNVSNSQISVSPSSVGAGPVVFIVTNQANMAEALAISRAGSTGAIARTAPINPQGTTQVSVNFRPGIYTIATARTGTDAQLSGQPSIRSASIHIGHERPSSSSSLLAP